MPIQRQSEQYGAFDSGPRWERDRGSHDLPKGLAGLMNSMGPSIQAGLLNTRLAVNTEGMDPDSHAYHTELPVNGPAPGRIYNPDFREYEPSEQDERDQEGVAEDDESGYNWGPDPRRASRHPFDRTAGAWQDLIDKDSPGPFDGENPEDFFTNWLERGGEEEHRHQKESGRINDFMRGSHTPDHEVPWEETDEGWHHPATGQKIVPSDDTPGHWQLTSPTVGDRGMAKIRAPHADPQAIMDWQKYQMGGPAPEGHKPQFRDHIFPPNPIPSRQSGLFRNAGCETCGVPVYHISGTGWVHADDDDKDGEEHDEDHQAEPDHDDDLGLGLSSMNAEHERRELQGRISEPDVHVHRNEPDTEDWENGYKVEHNDPRYHRYEPDMEREGRRTAAGEAPAPVQAPQGGGYQIGHRIGLDWRDKVIPGTVIGLDGPSVKIRWDDKQYSTEEPRNIRLL
jgi:hypothetical protein